jgi:hypothetical protein
MEHLTSRGVRMLVVHQNLRCDNIPFLNSDLIVAFYRKVGSKLIEAIVEFSELQAGLFTSEYFVQTFFTTKLHHHNFSVNYFAVSFCIFLKNRIAVDASQLNSDTEPRA